MSRDVTYLRQTLEDVVLRMEEVMAHHTGPSGGLFCPDCVHLVEETRKDARTALDHDDSTDDDDVPAEDAET